MRPAGLVAALVGLFCLACSSVHAIDADGGVTCALPEAGPSFVDFVCDGIQEQACDAWRGSIVASATVYVRCGAGPLGGYPARCASATSCAPDGHCSCGAWPECGAGSVCLDVGGRPACVECGR